MQQLFSTTLSRLFFRRRPRPQRPSARQVVVRGGDLRRRRPDFADTRPVIFRSEAFAEDLVLTHGR